MGENKSKIFPHLGGIPKPIAKRAVKAYKNRFTNTKNPLLVWRAYQVCREANIPIPDWIYIKLDLWTNNILSIDNPGKDSRQIFYNAMEMNIGSRSPWTKHKDALIKFEHALIVSELYETQAIKKNPKRSLDEIFDEVGKMYGASPHTVKKHWDEYKDNLVEGGFFDANN